MVFVTNKTRPRDFGNCREQSCNPTPSAQGQLFYLQTPFLPALQVCFSYTERRDRQQLPMPMSRGDAPITLPFWVPDDS